MAGMSLGKRLFRESIGLDPAPAQPPTKKQHAQHQRRPEQPPAVPPPERLGQKKKPPAAAPALVRLLLMEDLHFDGPLGFLHGRCFCELEALNRSLRDLLRFRSDALWRLAARNDGLWPTDDAAADAVAGSGRAAYARAHVRSTLRRVRYQRCGDEQAANGRWGGGGPALDGGPLQRQGPSCKRASFFRLFFAPNCLPRDADAGIGTR